MSRPPVLVIDGKLQCHKCKQTLLVSHFYRNKNRKCGYSTYCKACQNSQTKSWQSDHPERVLETAQRYRRRNPTVKRGRQAVKIVNGCLPCADCKQILPVSNFSKNRARKCGHCSVCKACAAIRRLAWYSANTEHALAYRRQWLERNPGYQSQYDKARYWSNPTYHRARIRQAMDTPEGRAKRALWQQQRIARTSGLTNDLTNNQWQAILEHYDHRCLACGQQNVLLTRDHIVPLTKGGALTLNNVQPLCRPCNASKGQQVIDYRRY